MRGREPVSSFQAEEVTPAKALRWGGTDSFKEMKENKSVWSTVNSVMQQCNCGQSRRARG